MNLVISQALASGLPVVSTKHSGIPDQVIDGFNGYLVDEGDCEVLAEKILFLIENPNTINKLSCQARSSVIEKYNKTRLLKNQEQVYRKVIGS